LIGLIQGAPVFAQSFASPMSYAVGTHPYDGALGDFNGDGKPDLAVANNSTENISVLLGNGDGTFGVKTDYDVGQPAYGVVVTDLNSDGNLDIVAETSFSLTEGVSVLLGNGNGSFQTRVDYLFSGLAQPKSILASDFNNDSKPDIVVINGSGATVLLGNGDGSLKPPVSYGSSNFATSVAVGDFDADGKIDLAVSSYGFGSNGVVSIMLGKGDGTFFPSVNYSSAPSPLQIFSAGTLASSLATAMAH
jgi:large repetitive protein